MIAFFRRYRAALRRVRFATELRGVFIELGRHDAEDWSDDVVILAGAQLGDRLTSVLAGVDLAGEVVSVEVRIDAVHSLRVNPSVM